MKFLLVFLPLLFAVSSQGQIIETDNANYTLIGKIVFLKRVQHKLESSSTGDSLYYRLTVGEYDTYSLSDFSFQYTSLFFRETGNVLNTFYEICKSVFKKENKYDESYVRKIKLGDYDVEISPYITGKKTEAKIYFWLDRETSMIAGLFLSEKDLDKLFGK